MALKSFYASSFFQALAEGLIKPFIPIFARSLGATNTLVGLISAIPNFVNTFSQVLWGTIADMYDRKKLMIIAGGIFWALLWLPIAFIKDPMAFLILLTVQAFLAAISVPSLMKRLAIKELTHQQTFIPSGPWEAFSAQ